MSGFSWVLLSFYGSWWVLTVCDWIIRGLTRVDEGFIGFDWVSMSLIGLDWVVLGNKKFDSV